MIIQNFSQLAVTPERKQALLIAEAGLAAIRTPDAVTREVVYNHTQDKLTIAGSSYPLHGIEKVVVVGFGKAAYEAVSSLYTILGERIQCGFVLDLKGGSAGSLTCTIGTHPFPTIANVEATKQIVQIVDGLTERDLLLCVVSGGGSSLLCYPYEISCELETRVVGLLMQAGADITELNTVRKHMSLVKGGQLAVAAFPAQVINLVFSDVPGDEPSDVASGPTLLDSTTAADARAILQKYQILEKAGIASLPLRETPKDQKYFSRVTTHTLVSGGRALLAMRQKAEDLGYRVRIWKEGFRGEARELGQGLVAQLAAGECVLGSGESTVTITRPGKGGRNLELALAALPHLLPGSTLIALDSDGHDNTPFAGALVDAQTLEKAQRLHIDPRLELETNNSYSFFEQTQDYIETGLTGANVADLVIALRNN